MPALLNCYKQPEKQLQPLEPELEAQLLSDERSGEGRGGDRRSGDERGGDRRSGEGRGGDGEKQRGEKR